MHGFFYQPRVFSGPARGSLLKISDGYSHIIQEFWMIFDSLIVGGREVPFRMRLAGFLHRKRQGLLSPLCLHSSRVVGGTFVPLEQLRLSVTQIFHDFLEGSSQLNATGASDSTEDLSVSELNRCGADFCSMSQAF